MILALTFVERFVQTLAKGVAIGSLYALVALGFVLIFKATQTVNFAQGAIALVDATVRALWTWICCFTAISRSTSPRCNCRTRGCTSVHSC